jgi:hypothetical protein
MPESDCREELQLLFDAAESFVEPALGHHRPWAKAMDRARAALAQPELVAPTDEELEDLAEVMNVSGNPVPAMRRALELWGNSQGILDSSMNHPITPPPELVQQWEEQFLERPTINGCYVQSYIAAKAAQYGLKISLDWLLLNGYGAAASRLSAARRPKPPSLKERSLQLLETYNTSGVMLTADQADTIRRALEALDD